MSVNGNQKYRNQNFWLNVPRRYLMIFCKVFLCSLREKHLSSFVIFFASDDLSLSACQSSVKEHKLNLNHSDGREMENVRF